jgi:K(+)-stimulated pyrophosphate-energized sodium pump
VLFASYRDELIGRLESEGKSTAGLDFSLSDPWVLVGLLIGGAMPFLFAALCMEAVGVAARPWSRRFAASSARSPGSWTTPSGPEYGRCVDIVTRSALRQMMLPAAIPVVIPIVVG